jgi:hypothetical protein
MIDLANDPTWFLYGIGVTVLLCIVMAVFVFFADRAQHH